MYTVSVDKIRPGMILATDVANREGRHILPGGTEITSKEIRILKMWGISQVSIRDVKPEKGSETQERDSGDVEAAKTFLNGWFKNNSRKNSLIQTLYDLCLERVLENRFHQSPVFGREKEIQSGKTNSIRSAAEIQTLLKDDLKLPALPTIFSEINAAVQNPKCSGKDIADIVSKDPSLSATLLRIVNSAYYGLGEKVESLHYAAMALGTHQVSSLALGITVVNHFKGIENPNANMEAFWRHSVGCAIAAKALASRVKGVSPERVFIGGMLHDIGWLVFLQACPAECNLAFKKARLLGLNLYQVEQKYFGMTHAVFGSRLAGMWEFPERLAGLIRHHHDQFKTIPEKEVALVYFANWLVDALGIGFSGEQMMPRLNVNAWKALQLPVTELAPVVRQIDRQIIETIRFFYD